MGDARSEMIGCLIYEEGIVANIKRGIRRIIWLLSVGSTIATWIILFSIADLSPQKKVNQAGVAFINWLDTHYFEKADGYTFDEFLLEKSLPENRQRELEDIKAKIEKSVKPDTIERWPYIWELKSPIDPEIWLAQKRKRQTVEQFDAYDALRGLWQDRLREAVRLNENEIKQTFPDIDIEGFMQRYSAEGQISKFNPEKYVYPGSYFEVVYQRPIGRMILLILLGFIPFVVIWFLWFLTQWVITGFKN